MSHHTNLIFNQPLIESCKEKWCVEQKGSLNCKAKIYGSNRFHRTSKQTEKNVQFYNLENIGWEIVYLASQDALVNKIKQNEASGQNALYISGDPSLMTATTPMVPQT